MELYKEILIKILEETDIKIVEIDKVIEKRCYKTLEEIIKIVQTPDFEDKECFNRIEKVITELEKLGTNGGFRHDFG